VIPSQREAFILDLLRQHQVVTVEEIATHCNCSPMSARRDLHRLEEDGLIRRTHGGAVLASTAPKPTGQVSGNGILESRAALIDRSDVLIVTPVRTAAMDLLVSRARRAGVPMIAEAVPYQGALTTVAIDDYAAGVELGRWVGGFAVQHRLPDLTVLDVTFSLPNTSARSRGFGDGLRDVLGRRPSLVRVDGGGLRSTAREVVASALAVHTGVNVVFGINDDTALGALDACRAARLNDEDLVVVSCGLEGDATRDLLAAGGAYRAGLAMFPELVGRACIDAAMCAYHSCPLPERVVTPSTVITRETIDHYYARDEATGRWQIHPDVFQRLAKNGLGLTLLNDCRERPRPPRVGVVQVFTSHDWYRNVRQAMQERCHSLDIRMEVIDASHDLDQEIDRMSRTIGWTAARFVDAGDTVILDTGKATAYLAAALHGRKDITVITNSLEVLCELADERGIRLITSGGVVRSDNRALVGSGAEETFRDLRATKAFVTGTGFSLGFGLSSSSTSEQGTKQAMVRAAREVFLLADHTTIGGESLVKVVPVEKIQRLITDSGISSHDRLAITQRGIEVTLAEDEHPGA
jgi:DeoR/GlpR family transcriptional regulator of sugar metabolism/ABC-type sugar transport system substrate-binding protein